jgi:hypothetical protein
MRTIDKTLNIQESIELFKNRIEILERGIKWLRYHLSLSLFY